MPSSNPTTAEFNALVLQFNKLVIDVRALGQRTTALEAGKPITTPPVAVPPTTTASPRMAILNLFDSIKGKSWIVSQQTHVDMSEVAYDKSQGISPGIIWTDPWMDNVQQAQEPNTAALIAFAKAGGIVGVSSALPNPITGGAVGDRSGIDPQAIITPGNAQYNAFMSLADKVAGYLKPLEDASIGYLHRPLLEADMGGFWYTLNTFKPEQYIALFRAYIDRLRSHGLNNMLPVFATNGNRVDHYPGADWVDVVGFDAYRDDPSAMKAHYDALKAQAPLKHIAFTEYGSGDFNNGNPNFNLQTFVDATNLMPDLIYANAWTGSAQGGWAWGYYQNRGVFTPPKVLQLGQFKV